jgi:hypothetical protein
MPAPGFATKNAEIARVLFQTLQYPRGMITDFVMRIKHP